MSPVYFTVVTAAFVIAGSVLVSLGHSTEGMLMLTAAASSFALESRNRAVAAERRTAKAEQSAQEALESTHTLRRDLLDKPRGE